jgi:hypothetical protein
MSDDPFDASNLAERSAGGGSFATVGVLKATLFMLPRLYAETG